MNALTRTLVLPIDAALFALGATCHALAGRTPRVCYHAMRRLYGPTDGWLNRTALRLFRRTRPAPPPATIRSIFGELTPEYLQQIADHVRRDGFVVLDRRLPPADVEALRAHALSTPCRPLNSNEQTVYRADQAAALRYNFDESDVLACPAASRLAFDGGMSAIATTYFGARARYDFTGMWWSTSRGERDLSTAAQEFHFDLDRLNFLKAFVYLTDVDETNGPHVYVRGSHRRKPPALRELRRFSDAEVAAAFRNGEVTTICAPAGTVIVADTSGIHKGMPIVSGDRLMIQVEFTTSMFGQTYPAPTVPRASLLAAGLGPTLDPDVYDRVRIA